jgi:hypothetical protein
MGVEVVGVAVRGAEPFAEGARLLLERCDLGLEVYERGSGRRLQALSRLAQALKKPLARHANAVGLARCQFAA